VAPGASLPRVRNGRWRAEYEQLRAEVIAGRVPQGENARRLARFGLAGLLSARPAWEVVAREAPERRWTGGDARLVSLVAVYGLIIGGMG
jgi:hypothetical protein